MKDYVSRGINLLVLCALLATAGGVLMPAFPLLGLGFVAVAASLAILLVNRRAAGSTSQVIWEVEAEPVRVTAPMPGHVAAPKSKY